MGYDQELQQSERDYMNAHQSKSIDSPGVGGKKELRMRQPVDPDRVRNRLNSKSAMEVQLEKVDYDAHADDEEEDELYDDR